MNRIIAFLFFLLPLPLLAQQYLDKSKAEVKLAMKNGAHNVKVNSESATRMAYTLKSSGASTFTGTLTFDEKGKCIIEQLSSTCDSCMTPMLATVLATEKYNWKKINENQYVSDFSSKLMLELPPDGKKNTYKLMRMEWTRELYDLLMKN